MMSEPKPLASLSSGLLARKGQAKPAMRPQGFAGFGMLPSNQEDLGWNDMGFDMGTPYPASAEVVPIVAEAAAPVFDTPAPIAPVHAEPPAVVLQQASLEREMAPAIQVSLKAVVKRAPAGSKAKAAFTLRLEPERHLKLRLVCAVRHRSAQTLVLEALDAFLDAQPAIAELTRTAKQTSDQGR